MSAELVIIPINPFPSLHWFEIAGSTPVLDVHEHYVKQTYRNRFDILGVNGPISLTLPVVGQKGQKVPVYDIRLTEGNWQRLHPASIRSAYGRAAFFEHYYDGIEAIYLRRHRFLADFCVDTLNWCRDAGIDIQPRRSSELSDHSLSRSSFFEPSHQWPTLPSYPQVFSDRFPFVSGLSVIDVLMNRGRI